LYSLEEVEDGGEEHQDHHLTMTEEEEARLINRIHQLLLTPRFRKLLAEL
jgi:hypothetical protein